MPFYPNILLKIGVAGYVQVNVVKGLQISMNYDFEGSAFCWSTYMYILQIKINCLDGLRNSVS